MLNQKDKQIRIEEGFRTTIITDLCIPNALLNILKQARDENRPIKKILITPDMQKVIFGDSVVRFNNFTLFGVPVEVVDGAVATLLIKTYQWNGEKVE